MATSTCIGTYKYGCLHPYFEDDCFYSCTIENQKIANLIKVGGNHKSNASIKDVDAVKFYNCEMNKIPVNLSKIFPNLTYLEINNCGLKEVCREDLMGFKDLMRFISIGNPIRYLHRDLFRGLKDLESVVFQDNKLEVIEPEIFDEIEDVGNVTVNLRGNLNYNYFYDAWNMTNDWKTLQEMKVDFEEKFKPYQEKQKLEISSGQASQQIHDLTKDVTTTSLFKDFQSFIKNEDTKDLTINIGDRNFRVHKFVLAIRSSFLAKTFKDQPDVTNMNLIDISADVFDHILKFIYTDELPKTTNFLDLFSAAGKLQIKELQIYAASKLGNQINSDNVVTIFQFSCKYKLEDLKMKAFNDIKKRFEILNITDKCFQYQKN